MNEGVITRRLRKALDEHPRLKAARALIVRHCEMYQSGVPDLSVSVGQFTLWLELKVVPRKLTGIQEHNVKLLREGCFVVEFSSDGRHAMIDKLSMAGSLTFEQVVEEIVSSCMDNGIVRGGSALRASN